jgi:hypothetical protein
MKIYYTCTGNIHELKLDYHQEKIS